jgi:hypothetical protein
VQDHTTFHEVDRALGQAFAAKQVEDFLRKVKRSGLRARDFEGVLAKGLLGKGVPVSYAALGNSDQGQIREKYLGLVEQVPQELRRRFLKVYAYY